MDADSSDEEATCIDISTVSTEAYVNPPITIYSLQARAQGFTRVRNKL